MTLSRKKPLEHKGMRIVEGVGGYYHYHIAPADRTSVAYCGRLTMERAIPWVHWGLPGASHMPTFHYCEECDKYR
jgi:hypothetical protein